MENFAKSCILKCHALFFVRGKAHILTYIYFSVLPKDTPGTNVYGTFHGNVFNNLRSVRIHPAKIAFFHAINYCDCTYATFFLVSSLTRTFTSLLANSYTVGVWGILSMYKYVLIGFWQYVHCLHTTYMFLHYIIYHHTVLYWLFNISVSDGWRGGGGVVTVNFQINDVSYDSDSARHQVGGSRYWADSLDKSTDSVRYKAVDARVPSSWYEYRTDGLDTNKMVWCKKQVVWETKQMVWDTKQMVWDTKQTAWDTKCIVWDTKRMVWDTKRMVWDTKLMVLDTR